MHLDKDHLQPGAALRSTGAARRRLMPNSRLSGLRRDCIGTAPLLRRDSVAFVYARLVQFSVSRKANACSRGTAPLLDTSPSGVGVCLGLGHTVPSLPIGFPSILSNTSSA